jgi:hypothetical protein
MMVDLDKPFADRLRRQLAERRRTTGDRFTTCERMLPVLGPSPPATEEEITYTPPGETIFAAPARETIIPEIIPATERETISAAKPWVAAGISRASWYRNRKANG